MSLSREQREEYARDLDLMAEDRQADIDAGNDDPYVQFRIEALHASAAALRRADDPDEKRFFTNANQMTEGYTFDEALAEIVRLGLRCEELYKGREEDGWQDIASAPKDTECFVYDRRYGDTNPIRAIKIDHLWYFASARDCNIQPSHWHPMFQTPSVDPLLKEK